MAILPFIIFLLFYLIALAGIILPVLPGVPIALAGAIIAAWIVGFQEFGLTPLIITLILTILALALDYVAAVIGAKRYGASRAGVWGSILGSLAGLFFFPPFGFLLGAIIGAILLELLSGRVFDEAVRSGLGALLGTLGGVVAKLFILVAMGLVVFPRLL